MNIQVTINRGQREEVVDYQKVKLRSFEEPWFRFNAEDEKGKKGVYLPITWIQDISILPEEEQ